MIYQAVIWAGSELLFGGPKQNVCLYSSGARMCWKDNL